MYMLGVSVAPGVVDLIRGTLPPAAGQPAWFAAVVAGFSIAVVLAVGLLILNGRNWGRWLFVIVFVLGLPLMLATLGQLSSWLHDRPTRALLLVIQSVAQLATVVLLFVPEANTWFRAVKLARKSS
jgi:hypothetical protein